MALYELNDAQHATVLAALRCYEVALEMNGGAPADVAGIASNSGTVEPLTSSEVGDLCFDLNHRAP
jgi:hypothetical protein